MNRFENAKKINNQLKPSQEYQEILISKIRENPQNSRKSFDQMKLKELSVSILKYGLLQPIVVIKEDNGYIARAGNRRLRASIMAGLTTVKCFLTDSKDGREKNLVENLIRHDLTDMETAFAIQELLEDE